MNRYYANSNADLIFDTLKHHGVKVDVDNILRYQVDRKRRVVIDHGIRVGAERIEHTIPDHLVTD